MSHWLAEDSYCPGYSCYGVTDSGMAGLVEDLFRLAQVPDDRCLEGRCEGARRRAAWGCVSASRERPR